MGFGLIGTIFLYAKKSRETTRNEVMDELTKLGEFIKMRAYQSHRVEFYVVTKMTYAGIGGYILVQGDDPEDVEREVELLKTFVKSSLRRLEVEHVSEQDRWVDTIIRAVRNF